MAALARLQVKREFVKLSTTALVALGLGIAPAGLAQEVDSEPSGPESSSQSVNEKPVGEEKSVVDEKTLVDGVVLVKGKGTPLPGAVVFVTADRKLFTKTGADGRFSFQIPMGTASISIRRPDYDELEVSLVDGKLVSGPLFYLERSASYREVGIIRAKRKTEISQQSLSRQDLANIAGSGGDPVRGLQTLPSVLSTGNGSAQIVVRGGSPGDNKFYLDRLELPFVFHLGGLGAVVPLRMLSGVDLFAGGFSAIYPDATSSVVVLKSESEIPERFSGEAEISLLQSSVYVEGAMFRDPPVADKPEGQGDAASTESESPAESETDAVSQSGQSAQSGVGYRLGFRRSYLELFAPFFLKSLGEDLSVTVLPQVTDYQIILNGNHRRGTWQYYLVGASNRLGLAAPTSATDDQSGQSEFKLFNYFEVMGLRYSLSLAPGLGLTIVPQQTFLIVDQRFFNNKVNVRSAQYSLDTSLSKSFGPTVSAVVGVRPNWEFTTTDVDAIQFPAGGFTPFFDVDTASRSVAKRKRQITTGAAYLDVVVEPGAGLTLNPGVVYQKGSTKYQQEVDPRLSARYALNEEHALKAAWGKYSQRPNPAFDAPNYGNPRLGLERADHYVAGWEYAFSNNWTSDLQVYAKELYNLVGSATKNPADKYENNIIGRARGAEILIRKNPSGRYDGSVSYGYSVSERRDPLNGKWRLSDFDKTHNATLVAKYKVTGKWALGLKFQYQSGELDTQLNGGQFNQNTGLYLPIPPENPGILNANDVRRPDFVQLDLRSDYDIWFDTWTLAWFLEMQIARPGGNVVAARWNEDYSKQTLVRGIPLLPNAGVKFTF